MTENIFKSEVMTCILCGTKGGFANKVSLHANGIAECDWCVARQVKNIRFCDCFMCDCEKSVEVTPANRGETWEQIHYDQVACIECWNNHGECLEGTCRHIGCDG